MIITGVQMQTIKLLLVMLFSIAVAACGSGNPSQADARQVFENTLSGAIKNGVVKIGTFKKTDGKSMEPSGGKMYLMSVKVELEMLQDATVCPFQPQIILPVAGGVVCRNVFKQGSRIWLMGEFVFEKSENGWQAQKSAEMKGMDGRTIFWGS
jgi:hypothetical protein